MRQKYPVISVILFFVVLLFGCPDPGNDSDGNSVNGGNSGSSEPDIWTEVTGLDGLDGTWKSESVKTTSSGLKLKTTESWIYPFAGDGLSDGVKRIIEGSPTTIVTKYYFETKVLQNDEGVFYINQTKTKVKSVKDMSFSESEFPTLQSWQSFSKRYVYSGDVTETFSAGTPYTKTTITVYKKQ